MVCMFCVIFRCSASVKCVSVWSSGGFVVKALRVRGCVINTVFSKREFLLFIILNKVFFEVCA